MINYYNSQFYHYSRRFAIATTSVLIGLNIKSTFQSQLYKLLKNTQIPYLLWLLTSILCYIVLTKMLSSSIDDENQSTIRVHRFALLLVLTVLIFFLRGALLTLFPVYTFLALGLTFDFVVFGNTLAKKLSYVAFALSGLSIFVNFVTMIAKLL